MNFLRYTVFLMGFVSLFAIPNYKGFILVHLFLLLSFVISFFYLLIYVKKIKINKKEYIISSLILLFFATTILGTINSEDYDGIISSLIFLLCFLTIFILFKLSKISNINLIANYLKGFFFSSLFTSVFSIIENIYYYITFRSLLQDILPKTLYVSKMMARGESIINLQKVSNIVVYRSNGLSWDPGLSITGVVLGFIIFNENIVNVKYKKILQLLILIGIILSFSKTSLVALFAYFILKYINKLKINKNDIQRIYNILFILILLILFICGFFVEYNYSNEGNNRHLKYFSSIIYFYKQNIFEFFFGYGYTGVGQYFNKYVDWLINVPGFIFGKRLNPESTLTNIFFYGGFIGSLYWILSFYYINNFKNKDIQSILIVIILLMFGYSINSVWFNNFYFILLLTTINKNIKIINSNKNLNNIYY